MEPTDAEKAAAAAQVEATRAAQSAKDRSEAIEAARTATKAEAKHIAQMARSLGLNADDFVGETLADAQGLMIKARAKLDAEALKNPAGPIHATITHDKIDKQREAFADAYMERVLPASGVKITDNPYARRSMLDMVREYATAAGIVDAQRWSRTDLAHFALGEYSQVKGSRDAANIINANFPNFVTLNAITKIVAKGFEMGTAAVTYGRLVETQRAPDFKNFYIGGLGTGNLQQTAENAAFPELQKAEGVYNDTVKMWGGTLSLTLQALINDDTAQFDRSLRMAGAIAQKTIDKRVYQKLMCGTSAVTTATTWTNNTTSGCSPVWTTQDTLAAARSKINQGTIALMNKLGQDQNPLGTITKYYVAGPTSGGYLAGLLGPAGGGQTVSNAYAQAQELIVSPWLEASTLTGNSSTTYYVVSDPNMVTGLVLTYINGYESPQVQEFDAGAVGARKWKIWQPFEADLFYTTPNYAGAVATVFAAQQCTT